MRLSQVKQLTKYSKWWFKYLQRWIW